jgi:hypothetical protein
VNLVKGKHNPSNDLAARASQNLKNRNPTFKNRNPTFKKGPEQRPRQRFHQKPK